MDWTLVGGLLLVAAVFLAVVLVRRARERATKALVASVLARKCGWPALQVQHRRNASNATTSTTSRLTEFEEE